MDNLNLATTQRRESIIGAGTLKLAAVLLLVILVYFGLIFYGKYLQKNIDGFATQFDSQRSNFITGEEAKKVMGFQNRLLVANSLIGEERNMNQDLNAVAATINDGTYVDLYKYDEASRTITLDCYANNYETIAKQIMGFKSSDYFSSVSSGETKLDLLKGTINFSIILAIK